MRARRVAWLAPACALLLLAPVRQAAAQGNPCAANPCAAKANPCAANPCAAQQAAMIRQGDHKLDTHGKSWDELAAMGEKLWNDKSLSGTGATSCSTCHRGGTAMMNASFAQPYPHPVKMAKEKFGLDQVNAAEMVQMCMVVPMNAKPLAWNSVELAALTAYTKKLQKTQGMGAMNPCGAKKMNPCGANPCAANPCGAKRMNPCAANPCGAKKMNPCAANPCGGGS